MKVVIVGGGVAGLEALLALRDMGQDRLDITLVAATPDFIYRPMTVAEPFTHQPAEQRALEPIAAELGASFVLGSLARVHADEHAIELSDGSQLGYDALVLCVGGKATPAYANAVTFDAAREQLKIDELIDACRRSRLAFVVPPGVTWPLPIYELALMADRRARDTGREAPQCVVVTPEAAPLIMFGQSVSDAVAGILKARGIELEAGTFARESEHGDLVLSPGDGILDATRTVALPVIEGPRIAGLPSDDAGFLPIDQHARVQGVEDVYAAGDGTNFPLKQGGIATQQADAAASHIAARAGTGIEAQPFRPVLRGKLLVGDESVHLRRDLVHGDREGLASNDYLWWPPYKVAGRYLTAWLARGTPHEPDAPQPSLDVEVALPQEWHQEPMALDPYGPL